MVFFSSRPKEELPDKGDLLRYENYGPYEVIKRKRSQDTGSVYVTVKAGDQLLEMKPIEAFEYYPQLNDVVSIAMGIYQQWWLSKQGDLKEIATEIEKGNCAVSGATPTETAVKTRLNSLIGRNKLRCHLQALDSFDDKYPEIASNIYQLLKIVRIADDMAIVTTEKGNKRLHPLPLCALKVVVKSDGRKA